MAIQHKNWRVGDTRTLLTVTLQQENEAGVATAVNLTGLVVKVKIINGATGAVVHAASSTGVTVTAPADGKVSFDIPDAVVAEPGIFYVSFIVTESGNADTFPVLHNELQLRVCSDSQSAQAAYDASLI